MFGPMATYANVGRPEMASGSAANSARNSGKEKQTALSLQIRNKTVWIMDI